MEFDHCDKRRSISEYKCIFPGVDFSLIGSDDDSLWKDDVERPTRKLQIGESGM
ncbi:hypothetical protein CASFOL_035938 [Castilleja foliolosa]|uniref:Uncharacterized protein n=1 Tax=Castilleja foliolosa TaxID=1961234 RepID=A0ABD3BVN1_9LAMI